MLQETPQKQLLRLEQQKNKLEIRNRLRDIEPELYNAKMESINGMIEEHKLALKL